MLTASLNFRGLWRGDVLADSVGQSDYLATVPTIAEVRFDHLPWLRFEAVSDEGCQHFQTWTRFVHLFFRFLLFRHWSRNPQKSAPA